MDKKIKPINQMSVKDRIRSYTRHPGSFVLLLLVGIAAVITVITLLFLVGYILVNGLPYLKPSLFAWEYNSDNVSMMPAIVNTILMVFLALLFSVPFGIGAAIYLVEYAKKGNKLVEVVRLTAETLTGIPSIIYGLFGMLFFVIALGWSYSMLAGAMTLAIMVLPTVMRTTEEALICVPLSLSGRGALGLARVSSVRFLKLCFRLQCRAFSPACIPRSDVLSAMTAASIYTAGTMTGMAGVMNSGRTLAIHMYVLSNEGLHKNEANATAVVLLFIVLIINGVSSLLAKKLEASKA